MESISFANLNPRATAAESADVIQPNPLSIAVENDCPTDIDGMGTVLGGLGTVMVSISSILGRI